MEIVPHAANAWPTAPGTVEPMDHRSRTWWAGAIALCTVTACGGAESTESAPPRDAPTSTLAPAPSTRSPGSPRDVDASATPADASTAGESDAAPAERTASDSLAPNGPATDASGAAQPGPGVSIVEPELETLGDGTHFGYLTAVDLATGRVEFDVAQLLTGAAAIDAALAAGAVGADDPTPPGGSFVVNANALRRWLPTTPNVSVSLLRSADAPGVEPSSLLRLSALMNLTLGMPNPTGAAAHVVIVGGQVTAIEQQYLP